MGMMSEFKEFAAKGNVLDLAIGVVIGAAFGKVVSSMVDDLLMPIISWITGGIDFSNKFAVLKGDPNLATLEAAKKAGAVTFNYGSFITALVMFLIIAFILFMIIKKVNAMKKGTLGVPPPAPDDVVLLREIRDLLKK